MAANLECSFSHDDDDFIDFAFRTYDLTCGSARKLPPLMPPLKDRENPMEIYNEAEFLIRYRFTKRTVYRLLELLPLEDSTDDRGSPVPPMLRLLIALRFYGAATFQRVTGDLVGVSQSTVCRTVYEVSEKIAEVLYPGLVRFPEDSRMREVMCDFFKIAKFPGVTGCIDCTHVRIKSPGGDDPEVFRNRKGVFSINVQAITGPQLQFFDVVASWPGSCHDSRIFDNSRARALYETRKVPGYLLGDKGYACHPYLMTPLTNPGQRGSPTYRYNKAHIATRNSIERAFGVWKRRFPCLDMKMQYKPERAVTIITACAALHNLGRKMCDPCPPSQSPPSSPSARRATSRPLPPPPPPPQNSPSGVQIRQNLITRSFT